MNLVILTTIQIDVLLDGSLFCVEFYFIFLFFFFFREPLVPPNLYLKLYVVYEDDDTRCKDIDDHSLNNDITSNQVPVSVEIRIFAIQESQTILL